MTLQEFIDSYTLGNKEIHFHISKFDIIVALMLHEKLLQDREVSIVYSGMMNGCIEALCFYSSYVLKKVKKI